MVKVALIGFGAVAEVHLEAYRRLEEVRITGISDPAIARREIAQSKFGIAAFSDTGSLLAHEKPDIACVLTPAATHEDAVLECARTGIHVLCEKPLTLSLASAERMIAACHEHRVRLCYGASYRYLPALKRAREIILSGELGRILLLREQSLGGRGPEHRETLGPAHYPVGGPGGSGMGLVDHGIHLIDAFEWLMDARTVRAIGRGNVSGAQAAPEFALLEYDNGAIGHLLYEDGTWPLELPWEGAFSWGGGWDANGRVQPGGWTATPGCIYVHGERGSLRIFHYANTLYHSSAAGMRQLSVAATPMPTNFSQQLEEFIAAIRHERPTPVPGDVGLRALQTLLQIYATTP